MPRNIDKLLTAFFAICFLFNAFVNIAFYENKFMPKWNELTKKSNLFKDSAYSVTKKASMQSLLDSAKIYKDEAEKLKKIHSRRFLDKAWVRVFFGALILMFFVLILKNNWQYVKDLKNYRLPFKLENWQIILIIFTFAVVFVVFE